MDMWVKMGPGTSKLWTSKPGVAGLYLSTYRKASDIFCWNVTALSRNPAHSVVLASGEVPTEKEALKAAEREAKRLAKDILKFLRKSK